MKLVDSNVWLALILSAHEYHDVAVRWLAEENADRSLLFCRATQQSVLRLLTTQAVLSRYGIPALTNRDAIQTYQSFVEDRRIRFVGEPEGIELRWQRLATRNDASPKVWMDAYLAAFAITGGYQLVTNDRAFSQYPGLDLRLLALTR